MYVCAYVYVYTHIKKKSLHIYKHIYIHIYTYIHLTTKAVCTSRANRAIHIVRPFSTVKSHVSFAKEPYKRDNILQKRPVILSILLIYIPDHQGRMYQQGKSCHSHRQTLQHSKIRARSCRQRQGP